MATGSSTRVLRAPGRVVLNPTDLSAVYPYDGTEIGKTKMCAVTPLGTTFRVESEALGEATDILEPGNRYLFNCFLRGWDDDAVRLMMAGGYEAGAASQHSTFAVPGTRTPGESALSRAVVLLYVPDDAIHVPAVMVYNGVPDIAEGFEFALQNAEEFGVGLAVDCLRNSSGSTLRIGRLADLPLT